jgi:hypothetical protein
MLSTAVRQVAAYCRSISISSSSGHKLEQLRRRLHLVPGDVERSGINVSLRTTR